MQNRQRSHDLKGLTISNKLTTINDRRISSCLQVHGELKKVIGHHEILFLCFSVDDLAQMFVFSEEIVEDSESGLQIQVDNVFRSGFGLWQSSIHHQFKGQADIGNFFIKGLKTRNNGNGTFLKFDLLT